ncbi:TlpA family protein disulfide reductase [Amycolatopsis sp. NPDC003861]
MGALLALALSGCSSGTDAVSVGSTYEFVSPGGQTMIFYDPPAQRGTVRELSGEDLMAPGRDLKLSSFRDQVVVLNLWGSWCAPCRAETHALEAVYTATRSRGVQFLGVNVRDERTAAQDFVTNFQVSYPSIYDPSGRALLALNGFPRSVVPSTIVLDRRQRVAAVFLISVGAQDLQPVVERIAAEPRQGGGA